MLLLLLSLISCVRKPEPQRDSSLPPEAPEPAGKLIQVSFYGDGDGFDGKRTASGEVFNKELLTAAHRSLPFGTIVEVRDLRTGKSVRVRVNDRGPFVKGRSLDLSSAAARALGVQGDGVRQLEMRVVQTPHTEFR